jgi:hypothetical protein
MTREQAQAIREIVNTNGWFAVREHSVYGPIWRKALAEQKAYEKTLG